jgi:hypothetical protein
MLKRDQRDPLILGTELLKLKRDGEHETLASAYDFSAFWLADLPDYHDPGGFMSNRPDEHHSQTPQDRPVGEPAGLEKGGAEG